MDQRYQRLIPIFLSAVFLLFTAPIIAQTWNPLSDASIARWLPHSHLKGDKFYVLSGFVEHEVIIPSFEVYDIPSDTWTTLTPMPISKYENDTIEAGVTHMASILVGDTIWVVGGRTGTHPGPVTEEVWYYHIPTDSWHAGPSLPIQLSGGFCVNVGRTFHYIGGFFNACNGLQDSYHLTLDVDAWQADPANVTWENYRKPLPRPRSHVSIAHLAGKIYVFGGEHGHDYCYSGQPQQGIDLAEVDVYDVETDTWTQMPDLPYPRSHSEGETFTLDGKVYQVGSEVNSTTSETTLMFDPATGVWTEATDFQLPETIMAPAVCVYRDSLIISHGGYPGRNNPKAWTQYRIINRTPVYELGWNRDTVDFWVYQGLPASQEVFVWAKSGALRADLAAESPTAWLSTADSIDLDIAGRRTKISVNGSGLTSGTYYANLIVQGSAPDLVNPALTATYTPDTLVVKLTVGPSPDGVLLLDQLGLCDEVEVGTTYTFPVDILTPGATGITLNSSSLSDPTHFSLNSTLPAAIGAGTHDSLYFSFTPTTDGPFSTVFSVLHQGTGGQTDVMLTCEAIPACVVPENWIDTTLGTPNLTGSACVTGNTYRMTAGGKNIWSKDDEGHFLATPVSGDGEMVMKVNWLQDVGDDGAKIGIMLRNDFNANSANVMLSINPSNAVQMQWRTAPGQSTNKAENKGFYPPQWLKLTRVGNTFTAYHSEDGVTWMLINDGDNPTTVALDDTVFAGIAFTSHVQNTLSEAEVQYVSMNFNPVTFPVELEKFDAQLLGKSVKLRWLAANEENFSHYEVQRKTEHGEGFSTVGLMAAQGMSSYVSWDHNPLPGSNVYRLALHDLDGSVSYSDQVSVNVVPEALMNIRKADGLSAIELKWAGNSANSRIRLMDITGRELMAVNHQLDAGQTHLISIPGLSAGYYLVEVKWDGQATRKLVRIME